MKVNVVTTPIIRDGAGDTDQQIPHATLPLGKIPKVCRNSSNPGIDPVGPTRHPARGESFIRGDWAPCEETVPHVT